MLLGVMAGILTSWMVRWRNNNFNNSYLTRITIRTIIIFNNFRNALGKPNLNIGAPSTFSTQLFCSPF
ncbi:hypothetical protein IHE45_05G007600 [Dioscorea alata]|uniref:Uncharacterized protein n=1 Tax=Dioscorea alata TaxID=55571 RepID=A0ACB7VZ91_DIOAL|nr:hypothetical protein IHE45_05G007600 [Dioscorea alata]